MHFGNLIKHYLQVILGKQNYTIKSENDRMAWVSEDKPDQSCGGFQLQLLHDVFAVRFYGINTEVQLVCNLLIGILFTDQLYDLYFPPGKVIRFQEGGIGIDYFTGITGASCVYQANGMDQFFLITVFDQVPVGSVVTGLGNEMWFVVGRKDDDTCTGVQLSDMPGGFQTIDEGHIDIQQYNVRLRYGEQVQEFFAIRGGMRDQ
jgi:hypothetical protein